MPQVADVNGWTFLYFKYITYMHILITLILYLHCLTDDNNILPLFMIHVAVLHNKLLWALVRLVLFSFKMLIFCISFFLLIIFMNFTKVFIKNIWLRGFKADVGVGTANIVRLVYKSLAVVLYIVLLILFKIKKVILLIKNIVHVLLNLIKI